MFLSSEILVKGPQVPSFPPKVSRPQGASHTGPAAPPPARRGSRRPHRLRPSPSPAGHRGHPKHFAPAPHSFPSSLPPALPAPGSRDPAGFAFGRCKGENGNPGMARPPRGQLETVAREQPDPPPRQDGQTHSRRRADRAADPDAAAPIRPLRAAGPARRALGRGARGARTSSPRPARPTGAGAGASPHSQSPVGDAWQGARGEHSGIKTRQRRGQRL